MNTKSLFPLVFFLIFVLSSGSMTLGQTKICRITVDGCPSDQECLANVCTPKGYTSGWCFNSPVFKINSCICAKPC
ncbi:hypothetical protein CASFOL_028937 [Castilleja foliolosa]|uniref:Uncharacterized protein n=1 Tax=Castilleja foliolosa TaxID=1961234 RepID=A0ABD3CE50_9LAMI